MIQRKQIIYADALKSWHPVLIVECESLRVDNKLSWSRCTHMHHSCIGRTFLDRGRENAMWSRARVVTGFRRVRGSWLNRSRIKRRLATSETQENVAASPVVNTRYAMPCVARTD